MPLPAVSEKEYVVPDAIQHDDTDVLPATQVPETPLYRGHAVQVVPSPQPKTPTLPREPTFARNDKVL